ncbi:DUF443 family protein [Staphylococcus pettenkoferi]|uniref:DUF443 family protein n=1 Tax=Staphylococcus pettenkoferi TaxID=170573 RepID=UPI0024134AE3|nr:DUF443 family protein [Staphylococcus pettenkoferi]
MKKNSKYKIIHYNRRHFIIDINRNKLTFVFPLLNYVIRHKLIEINGEELLKIKTEYISEQRKKINSSIGWLGGGISTVLGRFISPLIGRAFFKNNIIIGIVILLVLLIPLLIIKYIVDAKNEKKLKIRLRQSEIRAFILPNKKEVIKNIFFNIFFGGQFLFLAIGTIIEDESHFIFSLGILTYFTFILFQNLILYSQSTITGRIGGIKWKQ